MHELRFCLSPKKKQTKTNKSKGCRSILGLKFINIDNYVWKLKIDRDTVYVYWLIYSPTDTTNTEPSPCILVRIRWTWRHGDQNKQSSTIIGIEVLIDNISISFFTSSLCSGGSVGPPVTAHRTSGLFFPGLPETNPFLVILEIFTTPLQLLDLSGMLSGLLRPWMYECYTHRLGLTNDAIGNHCEQGFVVLEED